MTAYAIYSNDFFMHKPWWMPRKLYSMVCYRANPRSKEYMLHVLEEYFPNIKLTTIENISENAEQIIMLYPDAIGLGQAKLESRCLAKAKTVTVLNGRRRKFTLPEMRINLLIKRFLEVTLLLELCFAPFLLVMGALLAGKDRLMGYSR